MRKITQSFYYGSWWIEGRSDFYSLFSFTYLKSKKLKHTQYTIYKVNGK